METIYLLLLTIIIMGVSFHYLSFLFILIIYFFLVTVILCYDIKKGIVIATLLFLYIIRLQYSDYNLNINEKIDENISMDLVVREGIGKVEKIDGKIIKDRYYIVMENLKNGNYELIGKLKQIEDKGNKEKLIVDIDKITENEKIKKYFEKRIDKITSNYSYELGKFYKSIILGKKGLIDSGLYKKFRYIGGTHILVISGLHISVIIWGVLKSLELFHLERRLKYIIVWIVLSCYVAIIGITPSITRAYIMGTIFIFGNIIYEKVDSRKSLLVSFIISLILVPRWIYDLSFLMSYTALFAILFIYPYLKNYIGYSGKFKKIYEILLLSLTIQFTMEIIFIFKFKTIQLFTFIPNIVIIPLGSLLVITSFLTLLLSFFSLEFLTIWVVNYLYIILIECVEIFSKIPYLSLDI